MLRWLLGGSTTPLMIQSLVFRLYMAFGMRYVLPSPLFFEWYWRQILPTAVAYGCWHTSIWAQNIIGFGIVECRSKFSPWPTKRLQIYEWMDRYAARRFYNSKIFTTNCGLPSIITHRRSQRLNSHAHSLVKYSGWYEFKSKVVIEFE